MRIFLCMLVTLMFFPLNSTAQTSPSVTPEFEEQHSRAIDLAHNDEHDKSLAILRQLLKSNPDYYPVLRDYVVVSSWNDMCDESLKYYKKIAKYPDQESYLIIPVSECMVSAGKLQQAKIILTNGLKKSPDDKDLKEALSEVQDEIDEQSRGNLNVNLENNNTNGPNNEWRFQTRYVQPLTEGFSVYGKYFFATSKDNVIETDDMNRIGIGAVIDLYRNLKLDQEFSTDLRESDEYGSRTNLIFAPDPLWYMNLEYTSYWEDISLRANAQGIKAKGWNYNADFHTDDYRWDWLVSVNDHRFTDANHRSSFYTQGGYAFELTPKREQRVVLELDLTRNSIIPTAAYFNPERASTIALAYKLDMVLDTRFRRHVDTLSITVGNSDQKNFGSDFIGGIFYQQDYDFNKTTSLSFGLGVSSKVYDGNREENFDGRLNFNKRF